MRRQKCGIKQGDSVDPSALAREMAEFFARGQTLLCEKPDIERSIKWAFLTEYGLFLAKTLTFLLAIGAVILMVASSRQPKSRKGSWW